MRRRIGFIERRRAETKARDGRALVFMIEVGLRVLEEHGDEALRELEVGERRVKAAQEYGLEDSAPELAAASFSSAFVVPGHLVERANRLAERFARPRVEILSAAAELSMRYAPQLHQAIREVAGS